MNETNETVTEKKAEENGFVTIKSFDSYNERRYGTPWLCKVTKEGDFDFSGRVGTYSGAKGCSGDLVVFKPENGQVYAYGQKDYRGHQSFYRIVKWDGTRFVPCNKLGKEKEND